MDLDFRKGRILAAIVETYVQTGEPVGSKVLAEMLGNCWWEPVLLSANLESATTAFLSTEEVSWSLLEKEAKCNIRCCAPQISDHH